MVPYKSFIASLIYGGGWLALLGPKLTPLCGVLCTVVCYNVVYWVTCELVQIMST